MNINMLLIRVLQQVAVDAAILLVRELLSSAQSGDVITLDGNPAQPGGQQLAELVQNALTNEFLKLR